MPLTSLDITGNITQTGFGGSGGRVIKLSAANSEISVSSLDGHTTPKTAGKLGDISLSRDCTKVPPGLSC